MREWGRKRKQYIPFFIVGRRSYFKFILKCVRRSTFQYTQMGGKSYYVYARRRRRQQFLFISHTPARTTLYYIFLLLLYAFVMSPKTTFTIISRDFIFFYHPPCIQVSRSLSLLLKIKTFYDFKKGLLPCIYICFLYHGNFPSHSRICFNIVMTLRKKKIASAVW